MSKTNKKLPQILRTPKGDDLTSWSQSFEAQMKHQKAVQEEVKKIMGNPNHRPLVKLSKRYQCFVEQELKAIKDRKERMRKKRNRNNKRKKK